MNVCSRIGLALVLVVLLAACGLQLPGIAPEEKKEEAAEEQEAEKKKEEAELRIPVEAELPARRPMQAYHETTGRVTAESRVEVVSKGTGQCERMLVEVGDTVAAGDLLAELDREEMEAQLAQTRVNVAQQNAALKVAEDSLRGEIAVGTEVDRDNARFSYDQAVATLKLQQVQLKNQTIRAPIPGVITDRQIQHGLMVTPSMPIFTIVDPTSYMLPIVVPEKELMRLAIGQMAEVRIDARGGEAFEAQVKRIDPAVDPQYGMVKVILSFDKVTRGQMREAAFARVKLVLDTHDNALVLPKEALIEENGRRYVVVVREEEKPAEAESEPSGEMRQVAKRIEVETGFEDSSHVEILAGIAETDEVITLGHHTLKPGAAIKVTTAREEILSKTTAAAEADETDGTDEVAEEVEARP